MEVINIRAKPTRRINPMVPVWISLLLALSAYVAQNVYATPEVKHVERGEIELYAQEPSKPEHLNLIPDGCMDTEYRRQVRELEKMLRQNGSPYAHEADFIVQTAEKYGIYAPLWGGGVPCNESSCYKACHRFNCHGWGIESTRHNPNVKTGFSSWREAIDSIFADIGSSNCYRPCKTAECATACGYNPYPQTWIPDVNYFMNQMDI